jgi:hypothetical protein
MGNEQLCIAAIFRKARAIRAARTRRAGVFAANAAPRSMIRSTTARCEA